ncbi:MAG: ABC transporter ATP-binding protein [Bacillota bacterium]|nr:ABC transporter ATP-binding protein [Bacillota bacterium]
MKLILKHMKGYWLMMLGAVLSIMLATLMVLINPIVIRYAVDEVIGGIALEQYDFRWLLPTLGHAALFLLLLGILRAGFLFVRSILVGISTERVAERLRNRTYRHIQGLSFATHSANQTGDLIQRCTSDLDTFSNFIRVQISELGRLVLTAVLSIVIMFSMNPKLTLIPILFAPVLFVTSYRFQRKNKARFLEADEKEAELTSLVQESLSGVRVIKAFGMEKFEIDRFEVKNANYRDHLAYVLDAMAAFFGMGDLLTFLLQGGVLFYGAWMTMDGQITLGTFIAFFTYVNLLAWPIKQLGRMLSDLGKATVSIRRLDEILSMPLDDEDGSGLLPEIRGKIEFDHVSFGYMQDQDILSDVSFTVEAGETLGIVGPTGSGKSSLVYLIQRLYDYRGSIRIDGVELRDIQKRWIRSKVGMVLQEPYLYSKTIRDNIGIVREDFTDDQIYAAARTSAIHDNILSFQDGYRTLVGEKGVSLSGGQKQRVAISRTVIDDDKRILIFDDSLSAVDTETDAAIRKALAERGRGLTTLIISHRIDTIRSASKILVLREGKVAEYGTHDQLVQGDGLYRKLWELQTMAVEA